MCFIRTLTATSIIRGPCSGLANATLTTSGSSRLGGGPFRTSSTTVTVQTLLIVSNLTGCSRGNIISSANILKILGMVIHFIHMGKFNDKHVWYINISIANTNYEIHCFIELIGLKKNIEIYLQITICRSLNIRKRISIHVYIFSPFINW